ncbi:MAG: hypothetical protein AB7O68_25345 [Pirellulales bacterium]
MARICWSVLAVSVAWASSTSQAFEFPPLPIFRVSQPRLETMPSMETLAAEIDWLEHHIDTWGTVVAKQPDIWGEARLNRHRQEFEREMLKDLSTFQVRLNASISRSDQAYLGVAVSLGQAAVAPRRARSGDDDSQQTLVAMISDPFTRDTEDNGVAAIQRSGPFQSNAAVPKYFEFNDGSISLEPTRVLDQKVRYLNHLQQLRRINEGPDTADAPGYSLSLVRIPISILPGKRSRKGHGAEITVTATPHLSEELLPTTFRHLVINDVVDTLVHPLYGLVLLYDRYELIAMRAEVADAIQAAPVEDQDFPELVFHGWQNDAYRAKLLDRYHVPRKLARETLAELDHAIAECTEICAPYALDQQMGAGCGDGPCLECPPDGHSRRPTTRRRASWRQTQPGNGAAENVGPGIELEDPRAQDESAAEESVPPGPTGPGILSTTPTPVGGGTSLSTADSKILALFDARKLHVIAQRLSLSLPSHDHREILLDIYTYLSKETAEAYDLMAVYPGDIHPYEPREQIVARAIASDGKHARKGRSAVKQVSHEELIVQEANESSATFQDQLQQFETFLWGTTFLKELADAQRANNLRRVHELEDQFDCQLEALSSGCVLSDTTRALAWAIAVESARLNEQLVQSIRETSRTKGCGCGVDGWMPFYGPDPLPEARETFMQYVMCRWPIHVFALDPAVDEQNIADQFSRRRELQLALALAFMRGEIGAQALINYSRRLEWDMATWALNPTAAGFSHGNDTFGWRFFPRFQTPDIKGTLGTLTQLIAGGPSRDCDRCDLEIEPGIRECVAIVVMPSFVPYVTFDTRSNWFCLTNPRHSAVSISDTLHLSRSVKMMEMAEQEICDHTMYRDGELGRLERRVHQLSAELPLQTMEVEFPVDNFESGGELLASGVSELSPTVYGWWGAPGARLGQPSTIYLLGKNFSVLQTSVLAGNVPAESQLVSRNVLQVTVPPEARPIVDPTSGEPDHLDIHVATPYGTTSHIKVSLAARGSAVAQNRLTWSRTQANVLVRYAAKQPTTPPTRLAPEVKLVAFDRAPEIVINVPSTAMPREVIVRFWLTDDQGHAVLTPADNTGETKGRLDLRTNTIRVEGENFKKIADLIKKLIEDTVDTRNPVVPADWRLYAVVDFAATTTVPAPEPIPEFMQLHVDFQLQ